MHRDCKNIDLTNWKTLLPWVHDCISRHKKRHDFRWLLTHHGLSAEDYYAALHSGRTDMLLPAIESIAKEAAQRIYERDLEGIPAPRIKTMVDVSSGKTRRIGCESAMQQVMDFIAVFAAMPIFERRISMHQASSMQGRGPVYGMRIIRKWIQNDNRAIRWAKSHQRRYTSKCRHHVKLDVYQCFPSCRMEKFLALFTRDCWNEDLLWLWTELLKRHLVDGNLGFMIGALVSQWAAQYLLSFLYARAMSCHKMRGQKSIKCVSHMLMFMDDMLLIGSNRRRLEYAVEDLIRYARDTLGLTIKPNWQIMELKGTCGIDMMGFVVYRTGKVSIRGRVFVRSRRMAMRCHRQGGTLSSRQARRIASYKGYYKHSNSRYAVKSLGMHGVFTVAEAITSKEART